MKHRELPPGTLVKHRMSGQEGIIKRYLKEADTASVVVNGIIGIWRGENILEVTPMENQVA